MNNNGPLVAFILVFVRRRISEKDVRSHPDTKRQLTAIATYAKAKGRVVKEWHADQTTNRNMRFFLNPTFLHACEQAIAAGGDVIVSDVVRLLEKLDTNKIGAAWKEVSKKNPDLISAVHFNNINDKRPFATAIKDISTRNQLRKSNSDTIARSSRSKSDQIKTAAKGGKSTKLRSILGAKIISPTLNDIIKINPEISLSKLADALNSLGKPAPRGGLWHATTVGNMLRRCRELGFLQKLAD